MLINRGGEQRYRLAQRKAHSWLGHKRELAWLLFVDSLHKGDLRLSSALTDQGAGEGDRTHDRRVPADLRADSLSTVPSTLQAQKR
ncbi:hypothetical protein PoB_002578200 [Plakobranchus ocellatus]|uniref:Uncharacterized protein n=1 Tax=Plakobranchus ocellatus TaxID=259542 RepID=A0AAV3ZXI9_9GAST|nr:hypothetical protein PoB_002578200 [Plakobranchus ocellatus]